MEQHTSKVETWDRVSDSYLDKITDSEEEMGARLARLIFELCSNAGEISAIELGSGSGHLSVVLATHGIHTTLLDFSEKALDRAKKIYSDYGAEGTYICQDLFELDRKETYDIAWNSGVMEHFNNDEIEMLIANFRNLDAKYFIIVVPNAESMPYLLYRYYMEVENKWNWGREFLRTDYVERFERNGFKKLRCFYLGNKYTEYNLNEALKRRFPYSEFMESGLVPESNSSLVGYVFQYEGNESKDVETGHTNENVEMKTKILELRSRLDYASDIAYALGLQKEEAESEKERLLQEVEEWKSENERLKEQLQMEINDYKAKIEEKDRLLEEMEKKRKNCFRFWKNGV